MAFRECYWLKDFRLNEGARELGWLCFLKTKVTEPKLFSQVHMTAEQLGIGQDPRILRLPDGLEAVEDEWFRDDQIQKLIVPRSVRKLGKRAFAASQQLREVIFAPDSQLEAIGDECFFDC